MFRRRGLLEESALEDAIRIMKEEGLSEIRILEKLSYHERLVARRFFSREENF